MEYLIYKLNLKMMILNKAFPN